MLKRVPSMKLIEYDNIIKNKDDLIKQLESLKDEAIYMLKNPYHDEVFQKDLLKERFSIIETCMRPALRIYISNGKTLETIF